MLLLVFFDNPQRLFLSEVGHLHLRHKPGTLVDKVIELDILPELGYQMVFNLTDWLLDHFDEFLVNDAN